MVRVRQGQAITATFGMCLTVTVYFGSLALVEICTLLSAIIVWSETDIK